MKRRVEELKNLVEGRVLEVGCGTGIMTSALNKEIISMDFSLEEVKIARDRSSSKIQFLAGDLLCLPFKNGSFDTSFEVGVMHHIPPQDRERAIRELERVTTSKIIFYEPNRLNPYWFILKIFRIKDYGIRMLFHKEMRPADLTEYFDKRFNVSVEYMGFIPNFVPRKLLPLAAKIEQILESSFLKKFSSHFRIILTKGGNVNLTS